jgi:hypothetical protein
MPEQDTGPFNRRVDVEEPRIEGGRVVVPECAYETAHAALGSAGDKRRVARAVRKSARRDDYGRAE